MNSTDSELRVVGLEGESSREQELARCSPDVEKSSVTEKNPSDGSGIKTDSSSQPSLPPCRVCLGKASGLHYGFNTCEACKVKKHCYFCAKFFDGLNFPPSWLKLFVLFSRHFFDELCAGRRNTHVETKVIIAR